MNRIFLIVPFVQLALSTPCTGTNLPAWIVQGTSYPIVTLSATSPSGQFTSTIAGSFVIDGQCTWSIKGLTLTNTPDTAAL